MVSKLSSSFLIIGLAAFLLCCSEQHKTEIADIEPEVKINLDSINSYRQGKSDALLVFMAKKKRFQYGQDFTDADIKRTLVDLTSNRSLTEPELPKLLLITGVLFNDLGDSLKAQTYYELEVQMADKALGTKLDEILKDNWRRSKVEALLLLGRTEELQKFKKTEKLKLKGFHLKDFVQFFDFKPEEIYASYSLKKRLDTNIDVVQY